MEKSTGKFAISIAEQGSVYLIRTDGYLDDKGGAVVTDAVSKAISNGFYKFILNFEKSPVINSQGISHILEICESIQDDNDGILCLVGLNELTRGVFKMVGLLEMTDSFESEAEALKNLS